MSHKLLNGLLPPPHKAIHDGESLFWTLVYLAITRAGPGGSRQDGSPRNTMSPDAQELLRRTNIVRDWCFDSQHVGYNKMQLFTSDDDFQKHVIPYMNPYFRKPLTELFLELWGILKPAFYNEGWEIEREFPIFFMKKAFEKALQNLPPDTESDPRIQELVKKVEAQRQADRQLIEEAIASLSNRQTTASLTTGTTNVMFDSSLPPSQKSTRDHKVPASSTQSLAGALGPPDDVSSSTLGPRPKKRKT